MNENKKINCHHYFVKNIFSAPLKKFCMGALAVIALSTSGCVPGGSYKAENILRQRVRMFSPVISADNKFLAAYYQYKGSQGKWGIVLYDIAADKLSPLPLDARYSWEKPVFSPDGKYLAVLKACGWSCPDVRKGQWLTLIDLDADIPDPQSLTADDVYQTTPAFSPDGKWVAWFERNYFVAKDDNSLSTSGKGLLIKKKNLDTGVVKTVYQDAKQKGWGSDLFYTSQTELLASISGSDNPKHEIHIRDGIDGMLATERPGLGWFNKLHKWPNYDGSGTGRVAFFGLNHVWDATKKSTTSDYYDLYIHERDQTRRITHEKTMPFGLRLSPDGRMAVTMGRENYSKVPHDVWIIDVETGSVNKTNLRQRLTAAIETELKKKSDE